MMRALKPILLLPLVFWAVNAEVGSDSGQAISSVIETNRFADMLVSMVARKSTYCNCKDRCSQFTVEIDKELRKYVTDFLKLVHHDKLIVEILSVLAGKHDEKHACEQIDEYIRVVDRARQLDVHISITSFIHMQAVTKGWYDKYCIRRVTNAADAMPGFSYDPFPPGIADALDQTIKKYLTENGREDAYLAMPQRETADKQFACQKTADYNAAINKAKKQYEKEVKASKRLWNAD